jgi:hypothetical protein
VEFLQAAEAQVRKAEDQAKAVVDVDMPPEHLFDSGTVK